MSDAHTCHRECPRTKCVEARASDQDKNDAFNWVMKENPNVDSAEHWFHLQIKAFLAGRSGTVPVAKVEEAVRAERERLEKIGLCSGCKQEAVSFCGWCHGDGDEDEEYACWLSDLASLRKDYGRE